MYNKCFVFLILSVATHQTTSWGLKEHIHKSNDNYKKYSGLTLTNNLKNHIIVVQLLSYVLLFCDPMDCSPPGFSIYGISQARILEWVAISFSRGSPGIEPSFLPCLLLSRQILYQNLSLLGSPYIQECKTKITADGDCSHEIKRCLLLGRKVMTNLDSMLKSRDIANKGPSSQSYGFSSGHVCI